MNRQVDIGITGAAEDRVDASTPVCWLSENGGHVRLQIEKKNPSYSKLFFSFNL